MQISLKQAEQYLLHLDLGYIIQTMCAPSYALPKWQIDDAQRCCELYKKFLWLQKKYPDQTLVPTRDIDEFWHNHILHTKQYFTDCKQIFGHYLHHAPALPEDNHAELITKYNQTKALFLHEFKQPLTLIAS